MIRPLGIDNGWFVVSSDSVWYARVLLLFSTSGQSDTESKTFRCTPVSTLETYDDPENGDYCHYCNLCYWFYYHIYNYYLHFLYCAGGWLESVGSQIVYELNCRRPVLYVIPIQIVLGKIPVVGTITYQLPPTSFRARPAIASRVPAMVAGCGLSTRGHWDRPQILVYIITIITIMCITCTIQDA